MRLRRLEYWKDEGEHFFTFHFETLSGSEQLAFLKQHFQKAKVSRETIFVQIDETVTDDVLLDYNRQFLLLNPHFS